MGIRTIEVPPRYVSHSLPLSPRGEGGDARTRSGRASPGEGPPTICAHGHYPNVRRNRRADNVRITAPITVNARNWGHISGHPAPRNNEPRNTWMK